MIYLASPYTHRDNFVMENRYREVLASAAGFIKAGYHIYSPIVHFHPMACIYTLPRDIDFWEAISLHMLDLADELWVLQIDGWQESIGLMKEVEYAKANGKPISYVTIAETTRG